MLKNKTKSSKMEKEFCEKGVVTGKIGRNSYEVTKDNRKKQENIQPNLKLTQGMLLKSHKSTM